jgi:hypothetical protein
MTVAQEALQYVFKLHAGFLQSYEVDEHKRMLKSSQIIMEAEAKHCEFIDTIHDLIATFETEEEFNQSGAEAEIAEEMRAKSQQVVKRLLRIAPNYVEKSLHRVPQDIVEVQVILDAFYGEVGRRMGMTQDIRVREVLEITAKYYASGERSFPETTEVANRIKYVLQDLIALCRPGAAEQDNDEFIEDILRLLESMLNKQTNQPATPNKEDKKPKRKGKKCKKSKKCFLDKMD